ncbi:hypothetical protein ACHAWC_010501 [Mediolabrus comicus]
MDELRRQAVADELRRRQLWGPADHKLSWTDMCKQLSEANPSWAKEIGGGAPLFTSEQIYKLKLGSHRGEHGFLTIDNNGAKEVLHGLRPEDAIHIPQLRLDSTGKIIEWNRSLCDLTGISPAQVVGKLYAEVLDEWLPNLTKEYREAAVEWINETKEGDNDTAEYDESCREDYLFPLPLPIKYESPSRYELKSWKNTKRHSGSRHYYEYVEILVAKTDHLLDLYPQMLVRVPQCNMGTGGTGTRLYEWNFDTSRWFGGLEFTLRRKQYIPSLQTLCRELLPKGDHAVDQDGSLAVTKPAPDKAEEDPEGKPQTPEEMAYTAISNYIRTCGPVGIQYIREVMNAVCKKSRNWGQRTKCFHFSADWSSNPETSTIHKSVVHVLGGTELIKERVDKGKMVWTLDFEGGGDNNLFPLNDDGRRNEKQLKRLKDHNSMKVDVSWREFKDRMTPVIAENKSLPITCGASDSTFILPAVNKPDLTILTLKIEGHECSDGSYGEEKFKAHATVQVPASLNLFQLHRVVCLTMNCHNHGTRETHEWRVPNVNSYSDRPITDDDVDYVQIGETYFVENGKREDYGMPDKAQMFKPEDDDSQWSVESANKELHLDRGCLRRNLRKVGSSDYMMQMPFCRVDSLTRHRREYPVAVQLMGLDRHPMFLYGEPPLPSSEEYKDYVSSLRGRIDPKFLQENIVEMGGYFAVPFKYGSAGGAHSAWYDSDDDSDDKTSIGREWAREVDEEMKRIDSLKPKKAAKGRKRKAPSKASAS